jgi:hypothetical protein
MQFSRNYIALQFAFVAVKMKIYFAKGMNKQF